ncbi:hypothetical protein BC830DRAFT_1107177, partial [Chytriomyces sp. MP71]
MCCPTGWSYRDGTCWQDGPDRRVKCPNGWTLQNGSCVPKGEKPRQCGGSPNMDVIERTVVEAATVGVVARSAVV